MSFDDNRYNLLLLQALGLKPLGPSVEPKEWTLRALFAPNFHSDCCVTIVSDGAWAALEWIVLAQEVRCAVMHEMGFRGFAPPPGGTTRPKIASHEVVDVEEGPLAKFLTVVGAVDPYSLPSSDDWGIDGMPVRCESQRGPLVHSFSTWSPSSRCEPTHHRYLSALLDLAEASLHEPQSHHTLAEVRTYLR